MTGAYQQLHDLRLCHQISTLELGNAKLTEVDETVDSVVTEAE